MTVPVIRIGGKEDLRHAQSIHDQYYVDTGMYAPVFGDYVAKSITAFHADWDDEMDRVWLAEADGRLVGYVAVCHTDEEDLQLRYLWVDPAARGHGLGQDLVDRVVHHAKDVGASGIRLWTMEGLDSARRIYESFGWTLTETAQAPWHESLAQQRYDLRL